MSYRREREEVKTVTGSWTEGDKGTDCKAVREELKTGDRDVDRERHRKKIYVQELLQQLHWRRETKLKKYIHLILYVRAQVALGQTLLPPHWL